VRTAGIALAPVLLGLALAASGCAAVAPWERGRLAKPQMALDSDPAQRELREHTYRSREAAALSAAGRGGGCGCY
jgi:hypothetical protein